jgi:hypothetical protein
MEIVNNDQRWLTDVNPINFKAREIVFYEMKITWTYAKAIEQMIEWNNFFVWEKTQKISFDAERQIFDMWWNSMVVEYENKEIRDNDIILFKKYFKEKWHFSEELENWRQVPEFDWYFDYKWKFYIIVDWLNKLTDETDSDLWIYKWVILNPEKFYWVSKIVKKEVDKNIWKVDEII